MASIRKGICFEGHLLRPRKESLDTITFGSNRHYLAEKMIEFIRNLDQTIGIIIRSDHHASGIEFYTPDVFSQQLAYMNRPAGYVIPPHVHNPIKRDVVWTQEVLFIKSGKVRVDFFTEGRHYLESRIVKTGDVILLAAGGHGFEMLEPSEMIEVKQGPYCGDQDKSRFDPIGQEHVKVVGAE